ACARLIRPHHPYPLSSLLFTTRPQSIATLFPYTTLFRSSKHTEEPTENDGFENVPDHIAIIMDGNGRWAQKRNLPRIAGHREGVKAVNRIVEAAVKYNVKTLTLYAFSTENWKRPKQEIEFLMKLPKEYLNLYLPDLIKNNVKVQTIGDYESLPKHTKKALKHVIDQ